MVFFSNVFILVSVYSLYNNSFTIAVELDTTTAVDPIQCMDGTTGLTGPCNYSTLPPPSAGSNTCNDVVRQVSAQFQQ